jgi:uncharacterized protein YqfB (UPF0267 family)
MSGFKFNFGAPLVDCKSAPVISVEAKEIPFVLANTAQTNKSTTETISVGGIRLHKVKLPHAEKLPMTNSQLKNAVKDSDVVPGVYEGGYVFTVCFVE